RVKRNYYDHGVRVWWLDACEPELKPGAPENLLTHDGPGLEVLNAYPVNNARAFFEGMRAEGETEIITLNRSAWAGSQRYGAALWSAMRLRERLRPYVLEQMRVATETGLPPMRPLFVDFPHDEAAWAVDDQFLFGPDLLVAPVYRHGERSREAHLPAGARWTDHATGEVHEGGRTVLADAPLHRIPLFVRDGAQPF
ncbi:family 31 glucosidase, partial [Saccharothrix sp. MB29]|nr:family 31 glucosidase [Saccharothrix sp. MB29]